MKRALKWIGIVFGVLIVVIIAALLLIPRFVDLQKYKPVLESKVTELTGRPFSVGSDLELSLFPWAGFSLSELNLGNTKGFAEKEFVSVRSFDVRVKLLPLLSRDVQIKRFVVNEPRIVLVKNKDGSVNWTQPGSGKPEAPAKEGPTGTVDLPIKALSVGDFSIKNGSATWIDHTSGVRREITDIDMVLSGVSLTKPIQLDLSASLDKKPLAVKGTIGPVGQPIGQQPIAIDLAVNALKEVDMTLKGEVENPLSDVNLKMNLALSEFSPRRLMEALDMQMPVQTADSKALSRVALKADLEAGAKAVSVSGGSLVLDDSKMAFTLKATDFKRPNLAFDIDLDQIDLDRYLPPEAEKKPATGGGGGEPSKPAAKPDFAPLRKMVLNGEVKVGKLTVKKAKLSSVMVKIRAKDGVIKLDPIQTALYDGKFDGKTVVNVSTDTPDTNLSVNLQGVKINPLMQDVMDKDILEGTTRADISLSMRGADAAAIKRTLNGKGQLTFNDGAIKGFDIAAMARNTKAAFGLAENTDQRPKTDFAEFSVPFTVDDGLFNTSGTALKSPLLRLEARGEAHLVEETLDFRVDPKVVATLKGQGDEQQRSGLLVPIIVSGTFGAPKLRPDMEALAKKNLDIDKQQLETRAQEALEQKVGAALGGKADAVKGLLGQDQKTDDAAAAETGDTKTGEGDTKTGEDAGSLIKGLLKNK